jgi:hypothetical protein
MIEIGVFALLFAFINSYLGFQDKIESNKYYKFIYGTIIITLAVFSTYLLCENIINL